MNQVPTLLVSRDLNFSISMSVKVNVQCVKYSKEQGALLHASYSLMNWIVYVQKEAVILVEVG